MKKMRVVFGTLLIFIAAASFLYFQGCNKKAEKLSENTSENSNSIDTSQANAFTDSDSDLTSVDYKDFYDALSSKGEWVQVTPDEIGVEADTKPTSEIDHPLKSMSLSAIFGVNSAYAQEVAAGAFFVWKPAPELAIGVDVGTPVEEEVTPAAYVPYTNGTWVDTDNGWYFQAATPEEEIVHHYGRWQYSPTIGWVWIPGRVWSPAWVDWREDDDYLAWAPMPYRTRIVNDVVPVVVIAPGRYVFVERRYFLEPVFRHRHFYHAPGFGVRFGNMRRLTGVTVVNHVIINRGPEVFNIEKVTGRKVNIVQINRVNNFRDVRFKDNVINTYAPRFNRVSVKNPMQPPKFASFNDAKVKYENKGNDISKQKEEVNKMQDQKKEAEKNRKTESFNKNKTTKQNPEINKKDREKPRTKIDQKRSSDKRKNDQVKQPQRNKRVKRPDATKQNIPEKNSPPQKRDRVGKDRRGDKPNAPKDVPQKNVPQKNVHRDASQHRQPDRKDHHKK